MSMQTIFVYIEISKITLQYKSAMSGGKNYVLPYIDLYTLQIIYYLLH